MAKARASVVIRAVAVAMKWWWQWLGQGPWWSIGSGGQVTVTV